MGVSRFRLAQARPAHLHMRRLVTQAVVSVTEACSRSDAAHSSVQDRRNRHNNGALMAIYRYKVPRCLCSGLLKIGTCLQHTRLPLARTVHGIPAPCASSPELICTQSAPLLHPELQNTPLPLPRAHLALFPFLPARVHSFHTTSFFPAATARLVYARYTPSDCTI